MKFWAAALVALAIGWSGPALAAVSPGCKAMADSAARANLAARGGFVAQFEKRGEPADEREKQQRLADAADAVQLSEAVRTLCAGPDDAAPREAVIREAAEHLAAVTASLKAGDCLPVLAAVQNRLVELARGLEAGAVDPTMPHVIGGALALNEQVRGQCSSPADAEKSAQFAEQGATLRQVYDKISVCFPAQLRYQETLERAVAMIPQADEARHAQFLREDYDPMLASVRAACGDLLNPAVIEANDAKIRDYATLKRDTLKAMEKPE
jgi:hypothetical protein